MTIKVSGAILVHLHLHYQKFNDDGELGSNCDDFVMCLNGFVILT
jgi:hypothetical protein